ncbi:MAG TPA: hypothetical protein VJJ28_01170 [Candidatus Paceibacterota bacterium]
MTTSLLTCRLVASIESFIDILQNGRYDIIESKLQEHLDWFSDAQKRTSPEHIEVTLFPSSHDLFETYEHERTSPNGLKPATIIELGELGIHFPDLQREFIIVAPGTMLEIYSMNDYDIPCLGHNDGGQRAFSTYNIGSRSNRRKLGIPGVMAAGFRVLPM